MGLLLAGGNWQLHGDIQMDALYYPYWRFIVSLQHCKLPSLTNLFQMRKPCNMVTVGGLFSVLCSERWVYDAILMCMCFLLLLIFQFVDNRYVQYIVHM